MKMIGKDWRIIGKRLDGKWMIPGVYGVFSGDFCSFLEEKKAGKMVAIAKKCMKKDLMKLVFVSFTRSNFSNF